MYFKLNGISLNNSVNLFSKISDKNIYIFEDIQGSSSNVTTILQDYLLFHKNNNINTLYIGDKSKLFNKIYTL